MKNQNLCWRYLWIFSNLSLLIPTIMHLRENVIPKACIYAEFCRIEVWELNKSNGPRFWSAWPHLVLVWKCVFTLWLHLLSFGMLLTSLHFFKFLCINFQYFPLMFSIKWLNFILFLIFHVKPELPITDSLFWSWNLMRRFLSVITLEWLSNAVKKRE